MVLTVYGSLLDPPVMSSSSYPLYEREFFDPYVQPVVNNPSTVPYDFYQQQQQQQQTQEAIIPYGWRQDWARPVGQEWPLSTQVFTNTHHYTTSLPESSAFTSTTGIQRFRESSSQLIESKQQQQLADVSPKAFSCTICYKSFSQAANLTAHKRVHTGEKPFECTICNRPFSQSSSLVTHRRTHTGERPYPCKHCEKAFTDSSTLTKHLRTHTGQKPYSCSLCQMRFTQSGNLHRHMKTHKN